jgi:hypothetical protein
MGMNAARTALRTLAFIGVGAITTLVIAWVCEFCSSSARTWTPLLGWVDPKSAEKWQYRHFDRGWGVRGIQAIRWTDHLDRRFEFDSAPLPSVDAIDRCSHLTIAYGRLRASTDDTTVFFEAGWPCSSMYYRLPTSNDMVVVKGHFMPLAIWWPGAAVDTSFYAFGWWLVASAANRTAQRIRRAARRRLSRCTNCGYELQGLTDAMCPECATPTLQRRT